LDSRHTGLVPQGQASRIQYPVEQMNRLTGGLNLLDTGSSPV